MFHLMFGLPWLVVATRFLWPLPWPLAIKVLIALLLLVASQYHYISRLSSGSVFAPELPRPLIIAFNLAMAATILLAVFQIALDLTALVLALFKGRLPLVPPQVRYGLGMLAVVLSAYGVQQALRVPPLKDVEVAILGLPAAFDGYRLVQLTDLHISNLFPATWARAVVERTNALDADLIVMTGDLIDGDVAHRARDVAPIADLKARDGVYAIPGNHEYFFDYAAWMRQYEALKLTPLLNRHIVLRPGEAALVIAGVTDRSAGRFGATPPDLGAALAGAPAGAPVILLDHQPMDAARSAKKGIALQLSGHTHGGMVWGLDRIVARANNGFVSGFYRVGAMQLYVNNGTALWPGFALRLGPASELTRITLRPAR
ncbi:metallophosphoesterase [Rhizobium rhizosphaerae]|uniref:Metallophosphoesterase n=1 Tax=Xaviernesmea rhizosphaerae TaxID=1672749 RepID=A0A1Q9ADA4_9HYPH|nr:metallophosphoesterase [Xaviernesmea rhizosphaerae]OLP52881.1 metallophosphoesterase [Xaviernesmea rhizosphaerae]